MVPGSKRFIQVGVPNDVTPDICICTELSASFIELNSNVLREALLADKFLTAQLLGIKVSEITPKGKIKKA